MCGSVVCVCEGNFQRKVENLARQSCDNSFRRGVPPNTFVVLVEILSESYYGNSALRSFRSVENLVGQGCHGDFLRGIPPALLVGEFCAKNHHDIPTSRSFRSDVGNSPSENNLLWTKSPAPSADSWSLPEGQLTHDLRQHSDPCPFPEEMTGGDFYFSPIWLYLDRSFGVGSSWPENVHARRDAHSGQVDLWTTMVAVNVRGATDRGGSQFCMTPPLTLSVSLWMCGVTPESVDGLMGRLGKMVGPRVLFKTLGPRRWQRWSRWWATMVRPGACVLKAPGLRHGLPKVSWLRVPFARCASCRAVMGSVPSDLPQGPVATGCRSIWALPSGMYNNGGSRYPEGTRPPRPHRPSLERGSKRSVLRIAEFSPVIVHTTRSLPATRAPRAGPDLGITRVALTAATLLVDSAILLGGGFYGEGFRCLEGTRLGWPSLTKPFTDECISWPAVPVACQRTALTSTPWYPATDHGDFLGGRFYGVGFRCLEGTRLGWPSLTKPLTTEPTTWVECKTSACFACTPLFPPSRTADGRCGSVEALMNLQDGLSLQIPLHRMFDSIHYWLMDVVEHAMQWSPASVCFPVSHPLSHYLSQWRRVDLFAVSRDPLSLETFPCSLIHIAGCLGVVGGMFVWNWSSLRLRRSIPASAPLRTWPPPYDFDHAARRFLEGIWLPFPVSFTGQWPLCLIFNFDFINVNDLLFLGLQSRVGRWLILPWLDNAPTLSKVNHVA